jgi:thiol:disulfide interchange protein DsbD
MKRSVLLFVLCVSSISLISQISHAQWTLASKKISNCEYDLVFTVTLDKGWHTFSINKIKGAEKDVAPTEIIFKPNNGYALVGSMTESKPTPEYDPTIKKTVLLHYNKAVFTQRVKLSSKGKVRISGTYMGQTCSNGMCSAPPKDKFDFDLQGSDCAKK